MPRTLRLIIGGDDAGHQDEETLEADLAAHPLVASVVDVGVDADVRTPHPTAALEAAQRVIGLELARRLVRGWPTHRLDATSASAAEVAETSRYEQRTLA